MPIFQYRCPDCGHVEDLIRKIAEAEDAWFCSKCGSQTKHVQETPSRFQWGKSGGWS